MTVQQNAAGGLGVSPILLIIPKIGGQRVGMNQDNTMTVQRNAAGGFGGVPHSLDLPPRLGGHGLNQDNAVTVQRNAAGGLGVSPILSIFPQDWGLGG